MNFSFIYLWHFNLFYHLVNSNFNKHLLFERYDVTCWNTKKKVWSPLLSHLLSGHYQFYFIFLFFNWIVVLQCCIGFCHTTI